MRELKMVIEREEKCFLLERRRGREEDQVECRGIKGEARMRVLESKKRTNEELRAKIDEHLRKTSEEEEIERDRGTKGKATLPYPGKLMPSEQNGKQKKDTGTRPPTQLPWTIWSPLTTHMDNTASLF